MKTKATTVNGNVGASTAAQTTRRILHHTLHPRRQLCSSKRVRLKYIGYTGRDICATIEKTGVCNKDGFSVHMSEKFNTISITTKTSLITSKLLSIGEIKKDDKTYEVTPYMARASNQVKGVIYLQGSDNKETPETLMRDLMCRTNKIVSARVIGRSGRTVLITFDGKSIPKYVRFLYESYPV